MKKATWMSYLLATWLWTAFALAQAGYNEIFDERGQVRSEYTEAYQVYRSMSEADKKKFEKESLKFFQGDNTLDPMPRIIKAEEYDVLKKGVEQRAKAIQAFLADHYSGKKSYLQAGLIPQEVIERLLERTHEKGYQGHVNPRNISFMYGPDIIRDRRGVWRVIEDNPGFIGGIGDLKHAQKFMLSKFHQLADSFRVREADEFYVRLAERFKERARAKNGIAIIYQTPPYADNEDSRIVRLFAQQGVRTVTPFTRYKMEVRADGAYLVDSLNPLSRKQKVGFIMLNGEHWWLDPSHPENQKMMIIKDAMAILEEKNMEPEFRKLLAEELNKKNLNHQRIAKLISSWGWDADLIEMRRRASKVKGLTDLYFKGLVDFNYTPGIDFIGDKEFYLYVEEMIRHYLKQQPIIRNIETERFAKPGTTQVNLALFNSVFDNIQNWVIKKVDGRGGDAVWVGPKVKPQEIPQIQQLIKENPSLFIAQKYTELSFLNDKIVDLRVISDVGPRDVYVTNTPWGRGLPMSGNGKVNLSDQGREITVLIHEGSWRMCKNIFMR